MIPSSKHDLSSVENLSSATDEEVVEILPQLFEWLKDCNWPVFSAICTRIAKLKNGQEEHIRNVLLGNDIIWKCCIVGHLLPQMELSQVRGYKLLLQDLFDNASIEDYKEGLIDYVEVQLSRIRRST